MFTSYDKMANRQYDSVAESLYRIQEKLDRTNAKRGEKIKSR